MKLTRGFRRLAVVLSLLGLAVMLSGCGEQFVVLDPKGVVGKHQLDLILITTGLCLIVVVPVIVLAFVFAYRYRNRAGSQADYQPTWEHNTKLELLWWGIPILIIVILGAITAHYTYKLEPSKALASDKKPIVIQVTSLDWKWLFQYPDQGIATVNYVEFPANVPVRFELTSDAPMNSFWIPQLGGQIYTMSGMAMKLNLMADEPGTYMGMGANFSGREFGKMRFDAKATTQAEFDDWVKNVKSTAPALTQEGYDKLAEQGTMGTQDYSSIPAGLFDKIVTKYTNGAVIHQHGGDASKGTDMSDMNMEGMDMSGMDMSTSQSTADAQSAHDH